jgi:hypothetical protein
VRDIFLAALLFSAVVAFAIYLWRRTETGPWLRLLLLAGLLGSFLPGEAKRVSEAALGVIPSIILVSFIVVLALAFLRGNYMAYVTSATCVAAARTSSSLLGQGNTTLTMQGSILWAAVLAWLVFAIVRTPRPVLRP